MTISKEDYLKAIYKLSKKGDVTNKVLSNYLSVSASSITEMIRKMQELGYLKYENKLIKLTEKGHNIAVTTIRKHRVWELFLYNVLDFDLTEVHQEAEKLEHVTSDKLLLKLEKHLFFPNDYDEKNIDIDPIHYENSIKKLSDSNIGDKVVILNYEKKDMELKKYLSSKGIDLKQEYEIIDNKIYDSSLVLQNVNGNIIKIGKKAAEHIEIYKLK